MPAGEVRGQPRRDFILGLSLEKRAGGGEGWGPGMLGLGVAGSTSGPAGVLASPGLLRLRTLTLGSHGGRLQTQQEQRGAERRQAARCGPARPRIHGAGVHGLCAAGESRVPGDAGAAVGDAAGVTAGAPGPANTRGSRWRHPGGCSPAPPLRRAPGSRGAKRGCARGAAGAEGQGPEGGQWVPSRGGRSPRRAPSLDWAQTQQTEPSLNEPFLNEEGKLLIC